MTSDRRAHHFGWKFCLETKKIMLQNMANLRCALRNADYIYTNSYCTAPERSQTHKYSSRTSKHTIQLQNDRKHTIQLKNNHKHTIQLQNDRKHTSTAPERSKHT